MTLQSDLFKGDGKLEACLVQDSAHILQGAVGPHVGKIQKALTMLGSGVISADELSGQRYGPTTARSVLRFKTDRSIINRSYQSTPDAIVGKMTIAALDRELVAQQNQSVDGVHCKYCDCHRPVRLQLAFALSTTAAGAAPAASGPTPLPAGSKSPLAHAAEVAGTALTWATAALDWLKRTSAALKRFPNASLPPADQAIFAAVDVHFHLGKLPPADQVTQLDKLIANYTQIVAMLNSPMMWGDDPRLYSDRNDPRFGAYATATPGGLHDPSVDKKIWFHGLFLNATGVNCRCAMFLHECGHSVATALHYAYGAPRASGGVAGKPHANGATHPRKYSDLTPDEALHNADTYATFAAHASTKDPTPNGDFRPGAHDLTH